MTVALSLDLIARTAERVVADARRLCADVGIVADHADIKLYLDHLRGRDDADVAAIDLVGASLLLDAAIAARSAARRLGSPA